MQGVRRIYIKVLDFPELGMEKNCRKYIGFEAKLSCPDDRAGRINPIRLVVCRVFVS
ncbi:protein of unknown function [Nitrospina watsonii]|uniref:Uncharacterized protein n=1 Tax=Nitrospina watsonii TaxID=1323948 RepID=A0ABN8W5X5_9BACT|nr:protein of unknown function [Nitrospina watsonii]